MKAEAEDGGQASRFFDWNRYCYNFLEKDVRKEAEDKLKKFVNEDAFWVGKIKKRGFVFFSIVSAWVAHVKRTFYQTEFLQWNTVPGYSIIGKALIQEMQRKDIRLYSD